MHVINVFPNSNISAIFIVNELLSNKTITHFIVYYQGRRLASNSYNPNGNEVNEITY